MEKASHESLFFVANAKRTSMTEPAKLPANEDESRRLRAEGGRNVQTAGSANSVGSKWNILGN